MHPGIAGLVFLQLLPNLLGGSSLAGVILMDCSEQQFVVVVEDSLHGVNPEPRPVLRWFLTDSCWYSHFKRIVDPLRHACIT